MEYYAWVLAKFIAGFVIIVAHMNLSGKTQLSQMTVIDLIGNFVLGGIIGGVIYSDSIPFVQYIIVLLIGVLLISVLNAVTKHVQLFRLVAIGDPIPLIKNGKFLMPNILKHSNRIDILRVSSQLHAQGINSFQEISYAQIEPSGALSVICNDQKMPAVIVMKDGQEMPEQLTEVERDSQWLQQRLLALGVEAEDVFLAEFWDGKLCVIRKDGALVKDTKPE